MLIEEIVNVVIIPAIIPATHIAKKVIPTKLLPYIPIVFGVAAHIAVSQIQGHGMNEIRETLLTGISSGAISSSIYDACKVAIKKESKDEQLN